MNDEQNHNPIEHLHDDPFTRLHDADPARELGHHPAPLDVYQRVIGSERQPFRPVGRTRPARPIRRFAPILVGFAATAAVVTIAAGAPAPEPPQILADASTGSRLSAVETFSGDKNAVADLAPSSPYRLVFDVDGKLPALDSDADTYVFDGGQTPSRERLDALTELFGVAGGFVEETHGDGEPWEYTTWTAGPSDGSGPSIIVNDDPTLSWWYSPAYTAVGCDWTKPAVETDGPPEPVATDSPPCGPVTTPRNIPDADTALADYHRMLDQLGFDRDDVIAETFVSDWDALVIGNLLIDGVRSSLTITASYGENGTLVNASGFLGRFERLGTYPRIGTDEALHLLRAQYDWQAATGGPVAPEPTIGIPALDEPTLDEYVVDDEEPADTSDVAPPGSWDTTTADATWVAERVVITGVDEELISTWGHDERLYLIPGYAFTTTAGAADWSSRYSVTAIDASYFLPATTNSAGAREDAAAYPGTVVDITRSDAEAVVGMAENDAGAYADARGWAFRVTARDGDHYPMTMDFRSDRINVTVVDNAVTTVNVG